MEKRERIKKRGKRKRRRQDQEQGLGIGVEISQNEILSSERNVKGKEVNLEVSRVVGQKFRFGVGGRVKGQVRLGFGGKQGKMRCRRQVFTIKFQINALSEHNKKLAQKPNLQNPNFHYKNLRKFGLVLAYLDCLEKQGKSGRSLDKKILMPNFRREKILGLAPRKNFHEKISRKNFQQLFLPPLTATKICNI